MEITVFKYIRGEKKQANRLEAHAVAKKTSVDISRYWRVAESLGVLPTFINIDTIISDTHH